MKTKKPTGYIIYRGPSLIDGSPIVVVAMVGKSGNSKTGNMVQTYILVDGLDPREANKSGADYGICGDCPHKGLPTVDPELTLAIRRTCYVNLSQGVLQVYKALLAGNYPTADPKTLAVLRMVRLGTYGDPSAVPSQVWDDLLLGSTGHTAYSHQEYVEGADFRADLFMKSADSLDDAKKAWERDLRTFRVGRSDELPSDDEVLCPASEQAGKLTTCIDCGLCAGSTVKAKSIFIPAHGSGKKYFTEVK